MTKVAKTPPVRARVPPELRRGRSRSHLPSAAWLSSLGGVSARALPQEQHEDQRWSEKRTGRPSGGAPLGRAEEAVQAV